MLTLFSGYVIDLGNGGMIVNQLPVKMAQAKCLDKLSWNPKPSDIRCASKYTCTYLLP